jgi:hypothetical protein
MSEDRLEKALEEMRRESVDGTIVEAARARVWARMAGVADAGCAEFRPDLGAYLSGGLAGASCWKTISAAALPVAARSPN